MKFTIQVFAAFLLVASAKQAGASNEFEKREAPPPPAAQESDPLNSQSHSTSLHPANQGSSAEIGPAFSAASTPGHNPHGYYPIDGIAPEAWNGYSEQLAKLSLANIPYASPASQADLAGLSVLMSGSGSHGLPASFSNINSHGLIYGVPQASLAASLSQSPEQGSIDLHRGAQNLSPVSFNLQQQQGLYFPANTHISSQPLRFSSPIQLPQHFSANIQGLSGFGNGHYMALSPSFAGANSHSFPSNFQLSPKLGGPIFSSSALIGQSVPFGEQFLKGYTPIEGLAKVHSYSGSQNVYKTAAFKPSSFLGAAFESSSNRPVFILSPQKLQSGKTENMGPVRFGDSFSSPSFSVKSSNPVFAPSFTSSMNNIPAMAYHIPDNFLEATNVKYIMPTKLSKSSKEAIEGQEKKKHKTPSFLYRPSLSYSSSKDSQIGFSDNTYNTIKYSISS